jgi:hypothetical protein
MLVRNAEALQIVNQVAALRIGEDHAIIDDPNAQFGQSAQQVIDNCRMLVERGVTDTRVNPPSLGDVTA